uniref:Uncharacterized protein n=1 Tax=Tremella fuciformis TaxID=64657 RepID=D5KXZ4_9TREE|nr:unknown [Tremella fuciformis]
MPRLQPQPPHRQLRATTPGLDLVNAGGRRTNRPVRADRRGVPGLQWTLSTLLLPPHLRALQQFRHQPRMVRMGLPRASRPNHPLRDLRRSLREEAAAVIRPRPSARYSRWRPFSLART